MTEVREGAAPKLAVVREEVLRDYATMVKHRAREAMYSTLAERYEIEIDEETIRALSLPEPSKGDVR